MNVFQPMKTFFIDSSQKISQGLWFDFNLSIYNQIKGYPKHVWVCCFVSWEISNILIDVMLSGSRPYPSLSVW